jgi:hypothetical protein
MNEPKIQHIQSIKKLLNEHKTFLALRAVMPILRPILKLLKGDVSNVDDAFEKMKEMELQLANIARIPDKFNDTFARYGWIMYEMMDLDLADKTISLAEKEGIDAAEQELVNHYTPERVKWKLLTMHGVRAFHARMELANKALTDYEEERYHACVPVVLALLDGMVNEIHGKHKGLRRGFSSEEADLEAWDSIAAHSKGLNELKRIFNTGRYSTVTDDITIPYRNGILHGMDLGYDNKTVAAKSWAALFATREWAMKAEQGLLEEQPEKPQKSWKELFRNIDELNQVKKYQKEWIPRECSPEENLIISEGNEFAPGTPEHTLAEFLLLWKKRNYGKMGEHLSRFINGNEIKSFPAQIRSIYSNKLFSVLTIDRIVETTPSITLINGVLNYVENNTTESESITVRIIAETPAGDMALRITNETGWRIMDMNIIQKHVIHLGGNNEQGT